jgi:hypothetical protein
MSLYSLDEEDRKEIFKIQAKSNPDSAAKILGVGRETYAALVDPYGMVSAPVIKRVKEALLRLK